MFNTTGGPEVLRYDEIADPAVRPGGVLLEVRAIGIQGGDLINRREGQGLDRPHVVGYQASGVVREVGEGVTSVSPGQRVVAMMMKGSHAELASVTARKVWALPDTVSFEDAAALPVEFGTASDCLFEFGHLSPGETVLVQAGSGGVGLAAIQLAKAAGATVLTTSVAADGREERLLALGADHVVDYTQVDVVAEVLRLTDGRGADLVVDPIGGRTLEGSIAALAYRGRISWIGNAGRDVDPPKVWPLMEKNGALTAVFFAMEQSRQPQRTYDLIADLIARVGTGELKAVLDRSFALSDAAEAHRYVETGVAFGRVLMIP
ncbi:zinc-binding alcohol dehydrogenase family protein [Nocardioides marmoribigeumensis]